MKLGPEIDDIASASDHLEDRLLHPAEDARRRGGEFLSNQLNVPVIAATRVRWKASEYGHPYHRRA